jgi:hypothetical protein
MNPNTPFERDLEQWLQAEAPARAPEGFHAMVMDGARTLRQRRAWRTTFPVRRFGRGRGMTLLATAALLLVGGALAAESGFLRLPSVVTPLPSPSIAAVATTSPDATLPSPSKSAAPSASPIPVAGPGGVWIPIGTMVTPRSDPDAVELLDGRVLVVGGSGGEFDPATAELYDPVSGTWSATAHMLHPRHGPPPVVLLDGRVLVGDVSEEGSNGRPDVYGSELYDPITGRWSATGDQLGSGGDAAVVLPDGKVFATAAVARRPGGAVYDLATGTWTATAPRTDTDKGFGGSPILLSDGRVLVAGGYDATLEGDPSFAFTDAAEVYDPATASWTRIANMHQPSRSDMATLLPDGKALVVGRYGSWEIFDPASGTWTALAKPAESGFPTALLADGSVLMTDCPAAALYDPRIGSVTTASTMLWCGNPSFTLLHDGTVLVAGGSVCNGDGACVSSGSAALYVPAGVPLPSLPAFPNPLPPAFPSPTPVPTPLPPAAGPVPPNARRWTVTVDNRSSKPATLFVAGDGLELVGSATPNVVPARTTKRVTFLFPANEDGWIYVNPRPSDGGALVNADQIGIPGKILITADGQVGWLSP